MSNFLNKNFVINFFIILGIFGLDRITKLYVISENLKSLSAELFESKYLSSIKPIGEPNIIPINIFETKTQSILFQIYAVLYALDGEYQHRDLHENNVMVYTFQEDVQFEYKIYAGEDDHDDDSKDDKTEEIVSFRSKYLAKIIDYGRGMIPEMKPMVEHYETLVQDVNTAKDKYSNDSNDSTDAYGEYMEALHVHNETLEQLKKCGFHHITFDTDDFRLFPGARNLPFIVHTLKDLLTDSTQTQTPTIKMTIDARPNLEPNERSYITVENLQDDKMAAFLYESNESGLNSIKKKLSFSLK